MSPIHTRPARESDIPQILKLFKDSLPQSYGGFIDMAQGNPWLHGTAADEYVARTLPDMTVAEDVQGTVVAFGVLQGDFVDLGHGLAGSFAPTLTGSGTLLAGDPLTLTFADLPPAELGWMFVGVVELNAPFLGGVLVPEPLLTVILPTGAGTFVINADMPDEVPSGIEILVHMWVADAGGPFGASATNALKLVTP